jgi:hypothetical protein
MKKPSTPPPKPPLRWTGVLFALAANWFLVTASDRALSQISAILPVILAPLVAGGLTAFYTRQRGGIHAFLGGMLSVPLLGLLVYPGSWQLALLAGAFCTLGGAVLELVLRRRGGQ